MLFRKLAMWFRKRDINNVEKNGFRHSQCVVSKRHVGLYVESKLTNVESKLLLQLLLCGFDICLFLFDRTAKIDPTKVSTCWGSFVVSNPHVFNLTGQLESKPPEFPTLAATEHHTHTQHKHNTQKQDEPLPSYPQRLCPISPWQHLPWPQIMVPRLPTSLLQAPGGGFALAAAGSLGWAAKLRCIKK
jgi:hypothetical protein